MATEKQINANRRNAQHSTGPRTEEGKKRSRLNAFRHGLTGQPPIAPDVDYSTRPIADPRHAANPQ